MKKEICGTFHAKCGTRDLTKVFGTVPRKAGRVVTLDCTYERMRREHPPPPFCFVLEPLICSHVCMVDKDRVIKTHLQRHTGSPYVILVVILSNK
jgi:hypothetical protein